MRRRDEDTGNSCNAVVPFGAAGNLHPWLSPSKLPVDPGTLFGLFIWISMQSRRKNHSDRENQFDGEFPQERSPLIGE
jgi:hypothetical protein